MSEYPLPWVTDGIIEHLREGWAMLPFRGRRGHYWVEDTTTMEPTIAEGGRVRYYQAACGYLGMTRPRAPAMGVGTWPKCKRCLSRRQRHA